MRTPYAERAEIIAEYCACRYFTVQIAGDFVGEKSKVQLRRDPTGCPLHGDDPKHDLPESI